jgi:hypothetical protein
MWSDRSGIGWPLRPSLAPFAASPAKAHPLRLSPGYDILRSSGRGKLKRGASVAVCSSLAGLLARSLLATAITALFSLKVAVLERTRVLSLSAGLKPNIFWTGNV